MKQPGVQNDIVEMQRFQKHNGNCSLKFENAHIFYQLQGIASTWDVHFVRPSCEQVPGITSRSKGKRQFTSKRGVQNVRPACEHDDEMVSICEQFQRITSK